MIVLNRYLFIRTSSYSVQLRQERQYAEYVFGQDRIRGELELAASRRKEADARLMQLENMEYARFARERKQQEMQADKLAQAQQTHYLQTCPLLTEDTKLAINANADHRFRPDHFKGLGKEAVKQIYQENDAVVEEKKEISNAEASAEADWASCHAEMIKCLDREEDRRQKRSEEERRVLRDTLNQQKEELESRKKEMEENRLPAIGTDFFQRFGQSCR